MIDPAISDGDLVRLRPVRADDLHHFLKWLNDPDVSRWLGGLARPPRDMREERAWFESVKTTSDEVIWSIETIAGSLLGNIALHLSSKDRRALLGMFIGEQEQWGRGFATDAVGCLLAHAFGEMGLNRVELNADESNVRAIRRYERCGFQHEGLLREHRLVDGQFANSIQMAILVQDWKART